MYSLTLPREDSAYITRRFLRGTLEITTTITQKVIEPYVGIVLIVLRTAPIEICFQIPITIGIDGSAQCSGIAISAVSDNTDGTGGAGATETLENIGTVR